MSTIVCDAKKVLETEVMAAQHCKRTYTELQCKYLHLMTYLKWLNGKFYVIYIFHNKKGQKYYITL